MLRIISSKLAQRSSGDLSLTGTDQQILQPYTTMTNFIGREWKNRQREKAKAKGRGKENWILHPSNGTCPQCKQYRAMDNRGRRFCPSCQLTR